MKKLIVCVSIFSVTALTSAAQDWANLNKYRALNVKIQPPGSNENRVVYLGDSITDFWLAKDSTFFIRNGYIDRGISGQTTGQMLLRFRQDVINLKPKVVLLLAGINDIAQNNGPETIDEIFGNIVSMAQLAKANNIKMVLSSVLPASALPWRPMINPIPAVKALNELLKEYAQEHHLVYLDYYTPMVDTSGGLPAQFSKDGVHPTLAGYKVMEPLAKSSIEEALVSK